MKNFFWRKNMAGRRPKPTHLKVVTGNPGKRNDKEPQPAREIPSPPAHLTDWGETAWGRMTVLLDGMGILTVADTLP
jgi:phage terminase small subunit